VRVSSGTPRKFRAKAWDRVRSKHTTASNKSRPVVIISARGINNDHLEKSGRIILKWLLQQYMNVRWIKMVQDSVQRSVGLEIPVLKLWFTTREWYSQSIYKCNSLPRYQMHTFPVAISEWKVGLRFHILAAGSMKMTAFWDIVPCNLVEADRCFGGTYCFHHQGDRPED
jgi:hypothetical protein